MNPQDLVQMFLGSLDVNVNALLGNLNCELSGEEFEWCRRTVMGWSQAELHTFLRLATGLSIAPFRGFPKISLR